MRRWSIRSVVCILAMMGLAACAGADSGPTATDQPSGAVFEWERTPGTVLVRFDRLIENEPPLDRLNRVPTCTLFGDGRAIWVNATPPDGEEVLEAYVSEATMRAFLEFIIRDQQFYNIPDYVAQELPPSADAAVTSITLNLNREVRTVRSYREWPGDAYRVMLNRCRSLSDSPALLVPTGAWITVFPHTRSADAAEVFWPPVAPFRMAEVAASGTAVWVTDAALAQLWNYQRRTLGQVNWLEDGNAFRVAIQAPGVSRDAPPPPAE